MGAADIRLRMATQDDAQTVASIITTVSEGVIEYLLGDLFPGMTPEKILEMILIRGSGNLNLSNVLLVDVGGELAGLLFAYDAKEQTVSGMMEGFLGEARVKPMRPLLEAKVEKALWINTLWVNESFRGKGLSKLLMDVAGDLARERGLTSIALHCWADNERARRFYERCAFECRDVIPTADALLVRHSDAGELWVKALSEKNGGKA